MVRKIKKSVIRSVLRQVEAASSNKNEAEKFEKELSDLIKEEEVSSHNRSLKETKQVYFWKSCQIALL